MVVQARLAQYIKERGIKGSFIVRATGIHHSKVYEILNNKRELKADDLEKICNVIKADPSEFVKVEQKE